MGLWSPGRVDPYDSDHRHQVLASAPLLVRSSHSTCTHTLFAHRTTFNGSYAVASCTVNIGSGTARTWIDLANSLFAALGKKPEIEFFDMPESIRHQYQYYTCADISKLRATGYEKPATTLEDSVADYAVNYLLPGKRLGE